jgi:hypothetical protein
VEENEFYSETHQSYLNNIICQGITLNHTGKEPNEIYNNRFENLSDGIIAAGENRDALGAGLCIKCNDFKNNVRDISVIPGVDENGNDITSGPTIGVAENQGEFSNGSNNALAAGNTFSEEDNAIGVINYLNNVSWNDIDYVHHYQQSTDSKIRPQPISLDIDRIEDQYAYYSKDQSCPPQYGGGEIEIYSATTSFNAELNATIAYSDTLGLLVDGGDTQALTSEVNTSTEQEFVELRQELLDESPFLSDTVLKAAIAKDDALPNAMVRDVLVANPQSAKSDEVLMTLSQRTDTMPDYMINQILQGKNYQGAKELLEQKLVTHSTKKVMVMNDLIHHYLKDTSDLQITYDSIEAILIRDNKLESIYQLLMKRIGMRDSAGAYGLMYNIPVDFNLNPQQESEYELYEDLINLKWQMLTDSTQADSLLVDDLFDLYQAGLTTPGFYARNMLIGLGAITYEPPVYIPDYSKSASLEYPKWAYDKKHPSILRVFPNPAGDYFIVEYNAENYEGMFYLVISDIQGIKLTYVELVNNVDQQYISTNNYLPGFYIVQLFSKNKLLATQKVSISK